MTHVFQEIAKMYGPHFLILYGIVIALTLGISRLILRSRDQTGKLPLPPFPDNPDPYEIAYLRGGENEVTRLFIFDLIQHGYLAEADGKLVQTLDRPDSGHLSSLERVIFDYFSSERSANEVFESSGLPERVKRECLIYENRFQQESLLCPPQRINAARRVELMGSAIVAGLGGYKLYTALSTGHSNVLFLITMGIIAIVIQVKISLPDRLSRLGNSYLEQLKQRYEGLKKTVIIGDDVSKPDNGLSLLFVGLYGLSVLNDTQYMGINQMFTNRAETGGCGGGCGGGCDGGCDGCGGCG